MAKLSSPIDTIQKSLKIFFEKKNLITFLKIYSLTVPFSILTAFQDNALLKDKNDLNFGAPIIGSIALVRIGLAIITFWVGVAAILAIAEIVSGRSVDIRGVLTSAWKKLLWAGVLAIVIGLLVGLGFLLLIVPGIILMVWFSFANFELVTKGTGIKESLTRSKKLVEGRFWAVLGRIIVFAIFIGLTQIIFGSLPFVGGIVVPLLGALFILPYYLLYREVSEG